MGFPVEIKKQKPLSILSEPWVLLLVLAIFLALFLLVIYPLFQVIWLALRANEEKKLTSLFHFITSPYNRTALSNSLLLATSVSFCGTFIAFLFAFALTRSHLPFKPLFNTLALLPIISPPFVVALSSILLFGRNGLITHHFLSSYFHLDLYEHGFNLYGFSGLLLVQVLSFAPTGFLLLTGPLRSLNPALEEAALTLGANRWQTFTRITFPLLLPAVLSSLLLLFIESLADFGTPLILSGRFPVLSVQAYLEITGNDNQAGGAILALMLLLPSLFLYFLHFFLLEKKSTVTITGKPSSSSFLYTGRALKFFLSFFCSLYSLFILLIYGLILFGSFTQLWGLNYHLTASNYTSAISMSKDAILDSLIISALSAPLTGILGLVVAFLVERKKFPGQKLMEITTMLTFAVPGTVVGIGYILAFNKPPFFLQGTMIIIVALLVFRNLPVGVRAGITLLKQMAPEIEEAAKTMGASNFLTFRKVLLPVILPAFFSGLAYSFARSMTSISAVIFVVSGSWNLMTVAILGFVENAAFSSAAALSVLLIVIVITVLLSIEKSLVYFFRAKRVELEPVVT